jgi:hypothetical protein
MAGNLPATGNSRHTDPVDGEPATGALPGQLRAPPGRACSVSPPPHAARQGRLGLVVRLTLVSAARNVVVVPAPPWETAGADEVDGTGYADALTVDGVPVPLSDVVEASVADPKPTTRR